MREGLVKRDDQGKYFWELRSCAYWQEFEQPKIIYPDIFEHACFSWDNEKFFTGNTTYFIPTNDKLLCGILNSNCFEWYYGLISNKVRGGYMRAFTDYMQFVPIPESSAKINNKSIRIINDIEMAFDVKKNVVVPMESILDALVAHLYQLTEPEYMMILNDLKLSEDVRAACMNEYRNIATKGLGV